MSRVILVTDDLEIERRLLEGVGTARYAELVTTRSHVVAQGAAVIATEIGASRADVAILAPRLDPLTALATAEILDREHPEITTVVIGEADAAVLELALQVGVRAVLPADVTPERFADTVDRALEVSVRRRESAVIDLRDPSSTSPRGGRVITVIAPKGGSGKTTVATNLAAGLAQQVPDGVALVDLDLQFGDVADALRLDAAHTIGDLRGRAAHVDSAELKILLARHDCGLFALCAPDDPAVAEEVGPDDVSAAIEVLREDFQFVVLDTAAGIDEASLTAVEMSTDLVLLASNDVPSIRNLKKLLVALDRIGINRPTRHLVLNRAGSKVGIDVADVEATLGLPVAVALPSSRTITLSTNHGEPLLLSDPRSPASRPFMDLVARFTDTSEARSGGFGWLKRSGR